MYNVEKSLKTRDNNLLDNTMFDEIELCLSRSCNKHCVSCPHDNNNYNIQNKKFKQFMDISTVESILHELQELNYKGMIDLAGFGEPTLNPNFLDILELIKQTNIETRIVTNGVMFKDKTFLLNFKNIIKDSKINCIISTYKKSDVPLFKSYNVGEIKEIFLEDSLEDNIIKFKLNNRAGSVNSLKSQKKYNSCNYCIFMVFIDTDGDVQYCPHEWTKKHVFGNINDNRIIDLWNKKTNLRTKMLENKRQELKICKDCTAIGTVIGNRKRKYFEK